jgi:nifR3 family TIM-barrel protein
MISADGLLRNPRKCEVYMNFSEDQHPYGIQLFGSDSTIMKEAAGKALEKKIDFIDINMGCPVKKVVKKGAGSALMKEIDNAGAIVAAIKQKTSQAGIPLSAKIRSGWDKFSLNAEEFAFAMQEAGADFICIHARTRSQMYAGRSDWKLIGKLKGILEIPVIGNGDIREPDDAARMFEETGCDSVMIGRGVLGRPWIFNEIKDYLEHGYYREISREEKYSIIEKHLELVIKEKGSEAGLKEMRTHLSYYTRGFQGGAKVRQFINRSLDLEDILDEIKGLYLN